MNKHRAALILLLVTMTTGVALGEVLDRIVAIMNNNFIITLSDLRKERAIQAALGTNPGDDDTLVNALIERRLIEEQISQFREIEVDQEAIDQRLKKIGTVEGVAQSDLRNAIVSEMRRAEFMTQRFQQFIRVSDDELRKYYEEILVPELQRRGMPVPTVEQGMVEVRPNVVAEKMNKEVDDWLAELRRRSTIEKISK